MTTSISKWQRDYVLQIDGRMPQKIVGGKSVADPENQVHHVVAMPLTLEFEIDRRMMAAAQTGHFKIYNLSEATRRDLYHVWYESDQSFQQGISLFAGYKSQGDTRNLLFSGVVFRCGSYRQGPDWITEIEAFDGGSGTMAGNVTMTIPKATNGKPVDVAELIESLTGKMPFTSFGACSSSITLAPARAISFAGSPMDLAQKLVGVGGQVFVDNRNLYTLKDNEYIEKPGATGLEVSSDNIIGSPRREGAMITVVTLLEPSVYIGAACKLTSRDKDYNGTWQIRGVQHRGTISAAVCGTAFTTLSLWAGTAPLVAVQAVR